tara:strand:+ start:205 stop:468 length:264 start_codon:yes stop_codon:yes gene_type:complete
MKKEVKIMKEPGSTMRITNQTTTNSSQKQSLISVNAVVTGAIAVVMWCILPIIPILLAFCAGHFVRDNGEKLKKEREEYERPNSRRH